MLLRVGKKVVLFRFLTPDERHKWVDVPDTVPEAKEEFVSRPRGGGPLPNPSAIGHQGQLFPFGKGLQGAVGVPQQDKLGDCGFIRLRLPIAPAAIGQAGLGRRRPVRGGMGCLVDHCAHVARVGEHRRAGGILPLGVLPPPFTPALCASGLSHRLLLAPQAGEAIDAQRCGSRSERYPLHAIPPMQDKHWLGSGLGFTSVFGPCKLHHARSRVRARCGSMTAVTNQPRECV